MHIFIVNEPKVVMFMSPNALSFVMDDGLAAVTCCIAGDGIYAADGAQARICNVASRTDECGCKAGCGCYGCCPTMRPYRVVRADPMDPERFTAVTGSDGKVYLLNGCFTETGYITPENGGRTIYDACICYSGGEPALAAAYGNGAYVFDLGGGYKGELWQAPEDSFVNSFWALSPKYCAACYTQNGTEFLEVKENGRTRIAPVPRNVCLREVLAGDDGLYGLFGEKYVYNRLARIYHDGEITFDYTT